MHDRAFDNSDELDYQRVGKEDNDDYDYDVVNDDEDDDDDDDDDDAILGDNRKDDTDPLKHSCRRIEHELLPYSQAERQSEMRCLSSDCNHHSSSTNSERHLITTTYL